MHTRVQVRREKGVYHTLNKFSMDVTRKVGASCCWVHALCEPGEGLSAVRLHAQWLLLLLLLLLLPREPA